jgi:hypothetical protein
MIVSRGFGVMLGPRLASIPTVTKISRCQRQMKAVQSGSLPETQRKYQIERIANPILYQSEPTSNHSKFGDLQRDAEYGYVGNPNPITVLAGGNVDHREQIHLSLPCHPVRVYNWLRH